MKIKKFEVIGLHGNGKKLVLDLNDDLNILSGRNGAGKTTILKLMWYLISGNIETAILEVPFDSAKITTEDYELTIDVDLKSSTIYKSTLILKKIDFATTEEIENFNKVDNNKHELAPFIGNSYFFPTFRIIEGGFGTDRYNLRSEILKNKLKINSENEKKTFDLITDFELLSQSISNREHRFITSVSSSSINKLIISKYAEIMSKVNPLYNDKETITKDIIKNITINSNSYMLTQDDADKITLSLKSFDEKIKKNLRPINRLKSTLKFFIEDYLINFGEKVTFEKLDTEEEETIFNTKNLVKISETAYESFFSIKSKESNILDVNFLSAGEKQILNFISHNAFYDNTTFFIDEPEISLHADWQRVLFRMLMKQNPTNQFIISTHSPFIYSKYPEKEVCIDPNLNRGNIED